MNSGWLSGAATVLLLICFLGVVWWAWSYRRKDEFDRAARLPLESDRDQGNDEVRP